MFVEVAGNWRDFQVDLRLRGYRVVGGYLFEPGPARVRGEAFGGYMFQDYNGAGFLRYSTWTAGGSLAFLLAPRWTAVLEDDAKEASLSSGTNIGAPGDAAWGRG